MKRLLSLVGLAVVAVALVLQTDVNLRGAVLDEDFRTFIDKKDREIEAKVVALEDDEVTIKRKSDGRRFTLKIDTLSRIDQLYLKRLKKKLNPDEEKEKKRPDDTGDDEADADKDDDDDDDRGDGRKPARVGGKGKRIFEFVSADFREKRSKHFTYRYNGRSLEPAKKYAEKVWHACAKVMPDLKSDFENSGFRAPGDDEYDFDEDDGLFRYRIYIIGDNPTFMNMAKEQLDRYQNLQDEVTRMQLLQTVGMFDDFENRYLVHDMNPGRGGGREAQLTHGLASSLLQSQARSTYIPLWLGAGMGYYIEHELFSLCRVHYLDFSAYYKNQGAKMEKGEILTAEEAWTRPLRKLAKAGKTQKLSTILNQSVKDMTPEVSGYTFALTSFLLSDESKRAKYHQMIKKIAAGAKPDQALLLGVYGYDSAKALETAWYEYLKSGKFK